MENAYLYQLIALVLLVGAALFLFILPDRKKKKQLESDLDGLRPGDIVYTQNGLRGEVETVQDGLVTVRCLPDQVRLELARWGVVRVERRHGKA